MGFEVKHGAQMWYRRLSGLQLVIAIFGMFITLFFGGCAVVYPVMINPSFLGFVIIFGLNAVAAGIGFGLWYVATKWPWMRTIRAEPLMKWHDGLSVTRWFFIIFSTLIMLFCGGCALAFSLWSRTGLFAPLAISVVPFLIGCSILILAVRAGRS